MGEIALDPPAEAARILAEGPDAVYLDVRTEEGFAAGHAAGALNVPVVLRRKDAMIPNEDFLPMVENILPKGRAIFCGCQAASDP
jgi:rhodanese-related sulfurtransferase